MSIARVRKQRFSLKPLKFNQLKKKTKTLLLRISIRTTFGTYILTEIKKSVILPLAHMAVNIKPSQ